MERERERETLAYWGDAQTHHASQPGRVLAFISLGCIPRHEIAGSYGNYIFHFLKNHYIIFHSNYTILHSHQQCIRDLVSPHSHQHLLFFDLSVIAIPTGVR